VKNEQTGAGVVAMNAKAVFGFAVTVLLLPTRVGAAPDPVPARVLPSNPLFATVDRNIAKEPVYQTDSPRYALLAFGPKAAIKVWLVQDGETLYCDRDGDGDLTKPGNRITPDPIRVQTPAGEVARVFHVDFFHAGVKKRLDVQLLPDGRCPQLLYAGFRQQYAGGDTRGSLAFAASRQLAPVVHFDGPLMVVPIFRHGSDAGAPVTAISRTGTHISVRLGTPGIGPGTFAYYNPFNAPPPKERIFNENPVVELEFVNKNPAGPRIIHIMHFGIFT
jgi:hypothetical protein